MRKFIRIASGLLALLILAALIPAVLSGCRAGPLNIVPGGASDPADGGYEPVLYTIESKEKSSGETPPPLSEPETNAEAKAETKLETLAETQSGTKAETKPETKSETKPETNPEPLIDENGSYDDRDSVALYLHVYGKLPGNYMSKKEAEDLGWTGGSLERYAPGKCIGGSVFGNYEQLLPVKKGRVYHECDIGTLGQSSRGAKRLVYSNDGLIYYTDDHYETFTLLYGEV